MRNRIVGDTKGESMKTAQGHWGAKVCTGNLGF